MLIHPSEPEAKPADQAKSTAEAKTSAKNSGDERTPALGKNKPRMANGSTKN